MKKLQSYKAWRSFCLRPLFYLLILCLAFTGCGADTPPVVSTGTSSATGSLQTTQATTREDSNVKDPTPKDPWEIVDVNGLSVRMVNIDIPGEGDAVEIVQISDVHFSTVNDADRAENNELVMWSSTDLTWPKLSRSIENLQRALAYGASADQTVITGDVLSYLSKGNIEHLHKYIWEPYPETVVCMGNHDPLRSWNASTDESATLSERLGILEAAWKHDMYYYSKVISDRVMVIALDNASDFDGGGSAFLERQIEPFKKDLALAREKGYTVLLFYHVPLSTGDYHDYKISPLGTHGSAFDCYTSSKAIIGKNSKGASKQVYDLIVNHADVIKGAFCGHKHGDYYTEILAKNADGTDAIIPQYILAANPYDKGHVIKITLS